MSKHRFAEEHPADGNPIQTPDQFVTRPGLDRMRVAAREQRTVGFDDGRRNPCPRLTGAPDCGAALEDFAKCAVDAHVEPTAQYGLAQRPRDAHFLDEEHGTWV